MSPLRRALAVLLTVVGVPAAAADKPRAVIYTEPGNPLAVVPGRSDGAGFSSLNVGRFEVSPGGNWVLSATSTLRGPPPSTLPRGIVASGTPRGLETAMVEGDVLPGLGFSVRSARSLAINDAGQFAVEFATNSQFGNVTNTTLARYTPSTRLWDLAARQNTPIPGLDRSVPGALGETYGFQLLIAGMLTDGSVGFAARGTSGPLSRDHDDFLLVSGSPVRVLAQSGQVYPGQARGAVEPLSNLDGMNAVSPTAEHWSLRAQLGSAALNEALIVNGRVVLQTGSRVRGLQGAVARFDGRAFDGGHWYARGASTRGVQFLIVDGEVRALRDRPIRGLELFGNIASIGSVAMNALGDLAYQARMTTDFATGNYIVVERRSRPPVMAVSPETELDVGGSPVGGVFYGGPLGPGIALSIDHLYFTTRTVDGEGRGTGDDGLFVMDLPRPLPRGARRRD